MEIKLKGRSLHLSCTYAPIRFSERNCGRSHFYFFILLVRVFIISCPERIHLLLIRVALTFYRRYQKSLKLARSVNISLNLLRCPYLKIKRSAQKNPLYFMDLNNAPVLHKVDIPAKFSSVCFICTFSGCIVFKRRLAFYVHCWSYIYNCYFNIMIVDE